MTEYVIYYIYFFILCISISKYISRAVTVLLTFSPLIILLINRGDIGPDLPSYISIVEICSESFSKCTKITDPLFAFSIDILSSLSSNPKKIINMLGVFQILLMIIVSMQLRNAYRIFLMLYIPYFGFSYSFNTIRSGIALGFAALAVILVSKRSVISGVIFGFISLMFHYTYIFLLFFCSVFNAKLKNRYFLYIIIILCAFIFIKYDTEYLINSIYSSLNLQIIGINFYSGLSPLILSFLIIYISYRNKFYLSNHYYFISVFIITLLYIGVGYTYSALRLLELIYIAVILNYSIKYEKYRLPNKIPSSIILVSGLSAIFRIRNFWADSHQSFSMAPFNWN